MKTVRITAKNYDKALRFCNRIRKEKGMKPITKLPPGTTYDPYSCPCASACGAVVYKFAYRSSQNKPEQNGSPSAFIAEFDGKVPIGTRVLCRPIRGLK